MIERVEPEGDAGRFPLERGVGQDLDDGLRRRRRLKGTAVPTESLGPAREPSRLEEDPFWHKDATVHEDGIGDFHVR